MSADREGWWTSPDGLRLRYVDGGAAQGLPVVCLPGISRGARDFDPLAAWLGRSRRLIRPEMRGRGGSARADPATYTLPVEVGDILALLDALGVTRAAFIGTSRGGFQTMALAAARPGLVAAAALNDVGPVLAPAARRKITEALLATPDGFADWSAAEAALRARLVGAFDLDAAGWAAFARRVYAEVDGRPARDFDPALALAYAAALDQPMPDLQPWFDALSGVPTLVLRGANSEFISAATLATMAERRLDLAVSTIPGRGHAPFLDEPEAVTALKELLARLEPEGAP